MVTTEAEPKAENDRRVLGILTPQQRRKLIGLLGPAGFDLQSGGGIYIRCPVPEVSYEGYFKIAVVHSDRFELIRPTTLLEPGRDPNIGRTFDSYHRKLIEAHQQSQR